MTHDQTLIVELANQFYDRLDLSVSDADYLATIVVEKLREIRMNNKIEKMEEK